MQIVNRRMIFFALCVLGLGACQKAGNDPVPVNSNLPPNLTRPVNGLRLTYSDSIFYLKNQPGFFTVLPVTIPAVTGYFKANPIGLALDSLTGRINVTQSETGQRYKIYYINPAGKLIDSVKLVISGIDYADSIYRIKATPVAYDTAFPIYNATPGLRLPCAGDDDDDDDDNNKCVFDETDLDDDGNNDIAGAIQGKLLIDVKKGTIDAEASFHAGVFGSSDPANGVTNDFTFYYRLTDASNRALNKITVRLYHFKKVGDIPKWLLDELKSRENTTSRVNRRPEAMESKPKRPPIIIIVSQ